MNSKFVLDDFIPINNIHKPIFLAIGIFDGVHLGHVSVIESAISSAKLHNGLSVVMTFSPHPSVYLNSKSRTQLIMNLNQKTDLLFKLGLDYLVAKKFDENFSKIKASDFLRYLLNEIPRLKAVYVGENFRFGYLRKGSIDTLLKLGPKLGIDIWGIPRINQNGMPISSTRIRNALKVGDMNNTNKLLGYPYHSSSIITTGSGLGKKIGFPTINTKWVPECRPCYGVYIVRFYISKSNRFPSKDTEKDINWLNGIANYGVRPTITKGDHKSKLDPVLEIHSLDRLVESKSGEYVFVEWLKFIREEHNFKDMSLLKKQISKDCIEAKMFFNHE